MYKLYIYIVIKLIDKDSPMLKSICPKTRQFCLKHGRFTSESLRKSLGILGYLNLETRPSIFRFMQDLTNN